VSDVLKLRRGGGEGKGKIELFFFFKVCVPFRRRRARDEKGGREKEKGVFGWGVSPGLVVCTELSAEDEEETAVMMFMTSTIAFMRTIITRTKVSK